MEFTKVDLDRLRNADEEISQTLAERLIETFLAYHRELKAKNGKGLKISEIIVAWTEAHAGILDSLVGQTGEESLVELSLSALTLLALSRRHCDCEGCEERRRMLGLDKSPTRPTKGSSSPNQDDFPVAHKPNRRVH